MGYFNNLAIDQQNEEKEQKIEQLNEALLEIENLTADIQTTLNFLQDKEEN